VDVGGGSGALLPPILERNPGMRATVFDVASCRDGALRLVTETGLAARCDFVAGSFFESVSPSAADAYVVKSVLHDWDDASAVAILRTIRNAMAGGSRLLVIEPVAPERPGSSPHDVMIAAADLNMLIATGGRERTAAEFRTLLGAAGLHVTRMAPTPAAMSIIEARRT
jgi:O-methyltransferase domain